MAQTIQSKINSLSLFDLDVLKEVKYNHTKTTKGIVNELYIHYSTKRFDSFYNRVYKSLDKMFKLHLIDKEVQVGLNGWNHDSNSPNICANWDLKIEIDWM
jgi:hypothetical protein